jgi:5,10-methylenetetrahydrofolate reductase
MDLTGSPSFLCGCTIASSPSEESIEEELLKTRVKIAAGARFVVTPSVFDMAQFEPFLADLKTLGVPIIPTVFLLKSVGVARYIATNEPSAGITEDLIRRIRKAPDREMECVRIAGETVAALKQKVQGVRIVTLGWEHRLPAILDCAGL